MATETLKYLLESLGPPARGLMKSYLEDALRDREFSVKYDIHNYKEYEAMSKANFARLWREYFGPKYFPMSILSVERQAQILETMPSLLSEYRQREEGLLRKIEQRWKRKGWSRIALDLRNAAWCTLSPTTSSSGRRLQIGFLNYGCEYWQKNNGIGCYNCGYFAGCIPFRFREEGPSGLQLRDDELADIIMEQFIRAISMYQKEYDVIDFVGCGSFLNKKEIPKRAQLKIMRHIGEKLEYVKRILVESRTEYVDVDWVRQLVALLNKRQKLTVAIGLESVDEFVSGFCINKGYFFDTPAILKQAGAKCSRSFTETIQELNSLSSRVEIQAYVLIKPAFLLEDEAICDAVNTVRHIRRISLRNRAKIWAKFEPTVISYGSLLDVLYDRLGLEDGTKELVVRKKSGGDKRIGRNHIFGSPSYWSIAEIFARLFGDRSFEMCRIGAREDMDEYREFPGIYDGIRLSCIDPIIYNCIQQLNKDIYKGYPAISSVLAVMDKFMEDRSFLVWRRASRQHEPYLKKLSKMFEKEVIDRKVELVRSGKSELYESLARALMQLQSSKAIASIGREYEVECAGKDDIGEDMKERYKCDLNKAIGSILSEIKGYNHHSLDDLYTCETIPSVNLKIRLGPLKIKEKTEVHDYDIWAVVPTMERTEAQEDDMIDKDKRIEIERKWIIDSVPYELLSDPNPHTQAYIAISKNEEVRLRKRKARKGSATGANEYLLTCKHAKKDSAKRIEYEIPISKKEFDVLLNAADGRVIEKDRYTIDYSHKNAAEKAFKIELDIYKSHLYGLVTAEVEFENEEQEKKFISPKWFGAEVTLDKRFKNQSLATDQLNAIILTPNPVYMRSILLLTSDASSGLLRKIEERISGCCDEIKVLRFGELPVYANRINHEMADAIRSSSLVLLDKYDGDPSSVAWIAIRRQSGNPYMELPKPHSSKGVAGLLDRLSEFARGDDITPKGFVLGGSMMLSDFIRRQSFVDNEILGEIEEAARSVNVITTTLEQDIGELEWTVKRNLLSGKRYNYFIPSMDSRHLAYPELARNLFLFKRRYADFKRQITFYYLPSRYIPYFREIVIYDHGKYGYSYIEPIDIEHALELIELPRHLLPATMRWLKMNCRRLDIFE